jgi:hypothetical protein
MLKNKQDWGQILNIDSLCDIFLSWPDHSAYNFRELSIM